MATLWGGTPRDPAFSATRGPPLRAALLDAGAPRGARYPHRRGALPPVVVRSGIVASALLLMSPAAAPCAEGDAAPPPAARGLIPDGAALRVLGRDVKGPSGEVVAQVVNVLVDGSGRPLAAILDYGGFMGVGRRRIAVAWRALGFAPGATPRPAGGGIITLALSRDQLKGFPDHKDGEPVVLAAPAPSSDSAPAPGSRGPAPADAGPK